MEVEGSMYSGTATVRPVLRVFTIVFLALLALPYTAQAYTSNIVLEFDVGGNELIDKEIILEAVATEVGRKLDPDKIQEDVNNIYSLGYFSDVVADVEDIDRGKKVVFEVVENAVVRGIHLAGNTILTDSEILDVMETKIGHIFNIPILNEDGKRISKLYAERGHMFSGVMDYDVQEAGELISIRIMESVLEDIKITGNTKTRDYVIRNQLMCKTEEIFDSETVTRSLQKIFNLGFFKSVKPQYTRGTEMSSVVLNIEVEEQKTGMATLGGGYSSANGFVGFIEATENNLKGKGQKVRLKLEMGGITNYEASFFDPWFKDDLSFGVDLFSTKIEREEFTNRVVTSVYDEKRKGAAVSFGKPTGKNTTTSLKFTNEDVNITPKSNYEPPSTDRGGKQQTMAITVLKDTRDNYLQPSKGRRDSFSFQTTGGFLKGKNHFTKYTGTAQRYFKLTDRLISANRLIYGLANVTEGEIPYYDQYAVGGGYTLRGYEYREFLGSKMFLANLEIRYPLDDKLAAAVFYDIGDSWGLHGRGGTNLKSSYGFGIMFHSPIGTIRLDYGIPEGGRGSRSHFSMGSMF